MKKTLLLIIAICTISVSLSAQEGYLTIPFEKVLNKSGHGLWCAMSKLKKTTYIKGIPTKHSIHAVYAITVNYELARPKDSIEFNYYKKNKFHIYSGIDKEKNEKYIIIDKNNNYDFSDDEVYAFSIESESSKKKKRIQAYVDAAYYIKDNSIPITLNIEVAPFEKSGLIDESKTEEDILLEFTVWNAAYLIGYGSFNGLEMEFTSQDGRLALDLNDNSLFLVKVPSDSTFVYKSFINIGDSIEVANRILKLDKVYKNTLFLKDMGAASIYGGTIGKQFPEELLVKEIKSMKEFNLQKSVEGKYVFIDFWGSWCGPCIQSMPKLVEMHKKIGKRKDVAVIGLAGEDERDLQKLSGLIKEKGIKWTNYWYARNDYSKADSPCQKMAVFSNPTYIILDKSGKVVYRASSSSKAEEACSFFLDLIEKGM